VIRVWKDSFVNVGGAVASRGLMVAALPIITHQFTPEQVGIWPLVLSLASIFAPVATLRLDIVIPILRHARPALVIGNLLLLFGFAASLLLLAGLFLFPSGLEVLAGTRIGPGERFLIAVQLLSIVGLTVFSAWLVRRRSYPMLALAHLLSAVATIVLLIALPRLAGATTIVLVSAIVGGHVAGTLWAMSAALRSGFTVSRGHLRRTGVRALLIRHSNYPLYSLPYSLSSILVERGFPLLLGASFGLASSGGYYLLRQALFAPVSIVTTAFRQVMFGHAAAETDPLAMKALLLRLSMPVLVMTPLVAAYFIIFSTDAAISLLGSEWQALELIAMPVIVHASSLAISAWLDRVFDLKGRQRLALGLQLSSDFVVGLTVLLAVFAGAGFVAVVSIMSYMAAAYNILWLTIVFGLLGFSFPVSALLGLLPVAVLGSGLAAFSAMATGLEGRAGGVLGAAIIASAGAFMVFKMWPKAR
jgi:O-antigen/teichoic acid export membrane protein